MRDPKRNGRPRGSPAPSPCVWHAVSRDTPFEALTAGSRPRNPAHQPHHATLTDRFRRATTKSVIHSVVPYKAHLSRFDPPKGPLRQQSQTACKPGSVPHPGAMPGAVMAIPLGRSSPSASCDRPERRREGSPGIFGSLRDACRSYLVLLPVGFSLPPPLPAARCALTAPFHPCRPPGVPRRVGGVLSVALSLGSPPPGVTRHRTSVEPGLSSPRATAESGHPAVWHRKIWVVVAPLSKPPQTGLRCPEEAVQRKSPGGSAHLRPRAAFNWSSAGSGIDNIAIIWYIARTFQLTWRRAMMHPRLAMADACRFGPCYGPRKPQVGSAPESHLHYQVAGERLSRNARNEHAR